MYITNPLLFTYQPRSRVSIHAEICTFICRGKPIQIRLCEIFKSKICIHTFTKNADCFHIVFVYEIWKYFLTFLPQASNKFVTLINTWNGAELSPLFCPFFVLTVETSLLFRVIERRVRGDDELDSFSIFCKFEWSRSRILNLNIEY